MMGASATTGATAVMIGRSAQGRPWIFREINHYLATGKLLPSPTHSEIRELLLRHIKGLYSHYGDYLGLRIARKHVGWYLNSCTTDQPTRKRSRSAFNALTEPQQQLDFLEQFFANLAQMQEQVA